MKAQQSRNNHATMKKTKKITNVHDYSKEVDKIIATKKPIVEQFMDLMGLMDVTFIDENQTNNRQLNKHDKSVQDKQTSECCGAEVLTVQGYPKDEGTHYWQCSKCGAPCNIMNPCGSQTKRKRDATTGSTAAVHFMGKDGMGQSKPTYCGFQTSRLPPRHTVNAHLLDWEEKIWDIVGEVIIPCPGELDDKHENMSLFDVMMRGTDDDEGVWLVNKLIPFIKSLLSHQRQQLVDILKHNKDDMTGLYDYDGIAQEVIDLIKI